MARPGGSSGSESGAATGGTTMLVDFVRNDAGEVAWIRFSSRLAPRLG